MLTVAKPARPLLPLLSIRRRLGRAFRDRPAEIATGLVDDAIAQLPAQIFCLDLLDGAFGKFGEAERPELDPDQAIDLQTEVAQHVAHLAVLALADGEGEPDVGTLLALKRRFNRPIPDAIDGDAVAQFIQLALAHPAVGTDTVAPDPSGLW